jgi:plastocyanin
MRIQTRKLRAAAALLALAALGGAGYALADNASVALTATGPEPASVTVNWGETVTYTNNDAAEQVIAIPRAAYTSPAIPPGGVLEYAFSGRSGTFRFVQQGKRNFSGQVQVTTVGAVTLTAKPALVPYGKTVTLAGRSTFPASPVVVSVREAAGFRPVVELDAGSDGSYSARIRPKQGGRYQARVAADQIASPLVSFLVLPRISMRVSPRTVTVGKPIVVTGKVTPSRAADEAKLTAYDKDRKRWVSVQARRVRNGKVVFRAKLDEGVTRLRIEVSRAAANTGFSSAVSPFVRVLAPK